MTDSTGLTATSLPAGTVVFTHFGTDGKETVYAVDFLQIAVNRLVRDKKLRVVHAPVDRNFAKWCMQHRGIELHRLRRMTAAQLGLPVMFATQADGTQLLIDGHHRYVYAARKFRRGIPAVLIPPEVWQLYLVSGMPTWENPRNLIDSHSGIY